MGAKEFELSFKEILFDKRRVRNEIKWKLEKIMMVKAWYFHFSLLNNHVPDL